MPRVIVVGPNASKIVERISESKPTAIEVFNASYIFRTQSIDLLQRIETPDKAPATIIPTLAYYSESDDKAVEAIHELPFPDDFIFKLGSLLAPDSPIQDNIWNNLMKAAQKYRDEPPISPVQIGLSAASVVQSLDIEQLIASPQLNVLDLNGDQLESVVHIILKGYFDEESPLPPQQIPLFVAKVRSLYRNTSPYHNWYHAVDVLHFFYLAIHTPSIRELYSKKEITTGLLAALFHDLDHDGMTNRGHAALKTDRYLHSKVSTQEKHHLAVATRLIDQLNMRNFIDMELLSTIIDSTDMALHSNLKTKFEQLMAEVEKTKQIDNDTKKNLMIILLKAADLGNTVRTIESSRKWGDKLGTEFHLHWKREVDADVPYENRTFKDDPAQGHDFTQYAFFAKVVVPFFEMLARTECLSQFMEPLHQNALINKSFWEAKTSGTPSHPQHSEAD